MYFRYENRSERACYRSRALPPVRAAGIGCGRGRGWQACPRSSCPVPGQPAAGREEEYATARSKVQADRAAHAEPEHCLHGVSPARCPTLSLTGPAEHCPRPWCSAGSSCHENCLQERTQPGQGMPPDRGTGCPAWLVPTVTPRPDPILGPGSVLALVLCGSRACPGTRGDGWQSPGERARLALVPGAEAAPAARCGTGGGGQLLGTAQTQGAPGSWRRRIGGGRCP